MSHHTAPVRPDVTRRSHCTLAVGTFTQDLPLTPPRNHHSSRVRAGAQSQPLKFVKFTQKKSSLLAFKWNLKHICFYLSGSGKAAAGMTPDRKYGLWCFTIPKPPLASGVHKPPGSTDYVILTRDKQYLTPGEISLIFNLA